MRRGMRSSFPPQRRDQRMALQRQLQDGVLPEICRRKRRLKTKKTRNSDRRTEGPRIRNERFEKGLKMRTRNWTNDSEIFLIASWGFVYYSIGDKKLRTHA